jgi:lysophospholipase L1-like esterase
VVTYRNIDGTKTLCTKEITPDVIIIFIGTNDYNAGTKSGRPEGGINGINYNKLEEGSIAHGVFKLLDTIFSVSSPYNKCKLYVMAPLTAGDNYLSANSTDGTRVYAADVFAAYREIVEIYQNYFIPSHLYVRSTNLNGYPYMDNTHYHYNAEGMRMLGEGVYRFIKNN